MRRILGVVAMLGSVAFAQSAGPTPEALAACSGRAEAASCSVQLDDGQHDGVCLKAMRDATVSCMPKPVPAPPEPLTL